MNNSYGLAFSADGLTFTPIYPDDELLISSMWALKHFGDRIFLYGNNGYTYEYDGDRLIRAGLGRYQGFDLIDEGNNIYTLSGKAAGTQYVEKENKGQLTWVSPTINSTGQMLWLRIKDDHLIAMGVDNDLNLSVAYYLENNEWKSIHTTNYFHGTFEYNDRLFAYDINGIIVELVGN